jgi:hypothetical protein
MRLVLLLLLHGALYTTAIIVSFWPGSTCRQSDYHTSSHSLNNGACYPTGVNGTLVNGALATQRQFTVTCQERTASSRWSIQTFQSIDNCAVFQTSFNSSGSSCVLWQGSGVTKLDAAIRINCANQGWDGFECGSGDDAVCSSGMCRGGRCCKSGTTASCGSCSASGDCTACAEPGFELSEEGVCGRAGGLDCSSNNQCVSGECKGNCCAVQMDSMCTACGNSSVSGRCTACPEGRVLRGDRCLLEVGWACTEDGQCVSGACAGSLSDPSLARCCVAGTSPLCTLCDPSGICTSCHPGHTLSTNQLECHASVGGLCTHHGQCQSGVCAQQCCAAGTTQLCTHCDREGVCTTCQPPWVLRRVGEAGSVCTRPPAQAVLGTWEAAAAGFGVAVLLIIGGSCVWRCKNLKSRIGDYSREESDSDIRATEILASTGRSTVCKGTIDRKPAAIKVPRPTSGGVSAVLQVCSFHRISTRNPQICSLHTTQTSYRGMHTLCLQVASWEVTATMRWIPDLYVQAPCLGGNTT